MNPFKTFVHTDLSLLFAAELILKIYIDLSLDYILYIREQE